MMISIFAGSWPRCVPEFPVAVSATDRQDFVVQCIDLRAWPAGARVVRLGQTTFYQRARRKLRVTDSAEIPLPMPGSGLEV